MRLNSVHATVFCVNGITIFSIFVSLDWGGIKSVAFYLISSKGAEMRMGK